MEKIMKSVVLGLFFLCGMMVINIKPGFAYCQCPANNSVEEAFAKADAVVLGRVVDDFNTDNVFEPVVFYDHISPEVQIIIETVWKGDYRPNETILIASSGCGYHLGSEGSRHILYINRSDDAENNLVSTCSRSRMFADDVLEAAYLDVLAEQDDLNKLDQDLMLIIKEGESEAVRIEAVKRLGDLERQNNKHLDDDQIVDQLMMIARQDRSVPVRMAAMDELLNSSIRQEEIEELMIFLMDDPVVKLKQKAEISFRTTGARHTRFFQLLKTDFEQASLNKGNNNHEIFIICDEMLATASNDGEMIEAMRLCLNYVDWKAPKPLLLDFIKGFPQNKAVIEAVRPELETVLDQIEDQEIQSLIMEGLSVEQ